MTKFGLVNFYFVGLGCVYLDIGSNFSETLNEQNYRMETDNRALQQWDKSEISYINYANYISTKTKKFKLNLIDLLYVSNFKGGYATINETEEIILEKLNIYGQLFIEINNKFENKKLNELDKNEILELNNFADKLLKLTDPKSIYKIDGFSVSFLTALLHFYFPNLYPILDRRVLNGLKLITEYDLDTQGQVKNLKDFYPKLILEFWQKTEHKTIRELDREFFITKFHKVHYQEKIDKIFGKGSLWKHRTLRTLFDPYSSEYNETTMDKKVEILKTIIENKFNLTDLIQEYKEFYNEENKIHVVEIADEGLDILMKNLT